jgi:hypothetical protein
MAQQKVPAKASRQHAPLAEGLPSALPSESSPTWPSDNMAASASSSESSTIADILQSAMGAEPLPAPIHERLLPSHRTRADPDSMEPVDRPPSGDISTRDAAALNEVARSLATAEGCMTLLAQSTGGLMPLAVRHVLQAEMARAAGLLQLLRFLKGDLSPVNGAVFSSAVVQRVVRSAESERRLRGIALATRSSGSDVSFVADEALLANALLGLLLATFTLLDGVQNPQVELVVTVSENGEVALSVTQKQATAPPAWATHPVGTAWADAAGDVLSAVAMSASQRIAQAWGGRFAVSALERSTSLSIHLPAIHAPRPSAATGFEASQVMDGRRSSLLR